MNLVETIMKLLGDDVLGNLAGVLGAGTDETKQAVGAAVPAMLGGLGSLAAKPEGAEKLWSAVQAVDDNVVGNFSQMLTGGQQDVLGKMGSGVLEGLFGKGALSSLINVLGSFLGGKKAMITKLLPMLAPMIMGVLSKQVKSGGLDLGGLAKMLLGQKDNISQAMPAGLMKSLSSDPELSQLAGFAKSASDTVASAGRAADSAARATGAAAASPMRWLLPLVVLVAAVAGIYWFLNRPAPDATDVKEKVESTVDQAGTLAKDFGGYLSNMGTVLTGVTDVPSAQAALPKLEDMEGQLDSLSSMFTKLPAASRPALPETVRTSVMKLEEERRRIEEIPGVGDIVKSILDRIFEKVAAILRG